MWLTDSLRRLTFTFFRSHILLFSALFLRGNFAFAQDFNAYTIPADSTLGTQYDFLIMYWDDRVLMEAQMVEEEHFHSGILPYRARDVQEYRLPRLNHFADTDNRNYVHRKTFYEDFIKVIGEDFSLSLNPILSLHYGRDFSFPENYTYLNTRGIHVKGRIGKNVSFRSVLLESQGRFPHYQHQFFDGAFSAYKRNTVMGIAPGRVFKETGYDFPFSSGEISYTPSRYFNFSLGHGNHFFGEGYRSMFLSDHTLPYGFFRVETTFWKVKYVNMYSLMNNGDPLHRVGGVTPRKYTSMHYLSWNATKRLNINLYEAIIWGGDSNNVGRGFDPNFLNPVIVYRPLESVWGFQGGNVLMGTGMSYRVYKGLKVYGQLAVDDFKLEAFRQINEGHWLNFFAWQLGVKYPTAFGVKGLYLLAENNSARPFMYAHRGTPTSYTHRGLPLAHPWESSFREWVFKINYQIDGWIFDFTYATGRRGIDTGGENNGADPLRSYNDRSNNETGYFIGSYGGLNLHIIQARLGYIVNAATGMRFEGGITVRRETNIDVQNYTPLPATAYFVGLSCPLFNQYTDF
jgi:hypothetical protein